MPRGTRQGGSDPETGRITVKEWSFEGDVPPGVDPEDYVDALIDQELDTVRDNDMEVTIKVIGGRITMRVGEPIIGFDFTGAQLWDSDFVICP